MHVMLSPAEGGDGEGKDTDPEKQKVDRKNSSCVEDGSLH